MLLAYAIHDENFKRIQPVHCPFYLSGGRGSPLYRGWYFFMSKLGFTFYPQDWWTSDTFFEFTPFERYIYLECLFLMYRNDGYMKTQKTQFENRMGLSEIPQEIWDKITQKFEKNNLGYTSVTINARLRKAIISRKNGEKGGRPRKQNNPENPENNLKEKENIKEKIIELGDKTQKHFILIIPKYINDEPYRLWGVNGVGEYLEMNGSKWPRLEYAEKFLREKSGQPFNDFGHILNAYNKYIENQFK